MTFLGFILTLYWTLASWIFIGDYISDCVWQNFMFDWWLVTDQNYLLPLPFKWSWNILVITFVSIAFFIWGHFFAVLLYDPDAIFYWIMETL